MCAKHTNQHQPSPEAKRVMAKAARARKKLTRALEQGHAPWSKIDGLEKTLRRLDAQALDLIDMQSDVADQTLRNL